MNVKGIFVNMPVRDLDRSMKFFEGLGFHFNPQFTNEDAACMVIDEKIYVMLLTENHFKKFTNKDISDSHQTTEAIVSLAVESKEKVNEVVEKALSSGASHSKDALDYGFMYQWGFQDPDGHLWELFYMEESYVQQ